jgi:hypothetical protein
MLEVSVKLSIVAHEDSVSTQMSLRWSSRPRIWKVYAAIIVGTRPMRCVFEAGSEGFTKQLVDEASRPLCSRANSIG